MDKPQQSSFFSSMDDANKKALRVLETQGQDAFIKHVFTDPKDEKKTLSYAEMRMLYG